MLKKQLHIEMKLDKTTCILQLFLLQPDIFVTVLSRMMLKYTHYVYFSRTRLEQFRQLLFFRKRKDFWHGLCVNIKRLHSILVLAEKSFWQPTCKLSKCCAVYCRILTSILVAEVIKNSWRNRNEWRTLFTMFIFAMAAFALS